MRTHVEDAMSRDVIAVSVDTRLAAIARLLELHEISGVPVLDAAGHPIGVVSKTDLISAGGPRRADGSATFYRLWNGEVRSVGTIGDGPNGPAGVAADVMTPHVCAIRASADLHEAAERMVEEQVHRLFVVDRGRLVGVLAAMDCLRGLTAP